MRKILCALFCMGLVAACNQSDETVMVQQCGDYTVQMNFSDDGTTMHAVINGDALDLQNSVSASGARYDGTLNDTAVTLWQSGENWTMFLDDDTVIECNAK